MAKDTNVKKTETETIETEVIVKSRARAWWDNNKNKLFWFGVGTLTGAGTVIGTALLLEPTEEQYEGDNEPTVTIDTNSLENTTES